jgi:hypothetical protein
VFSATFNNISVISWRSVFICEGNRSARRKPPTWSKSLTNFLSHNVLSSTPRHNRTIRTPLKTGDELRWSGRVGSSKTLEQKYSYWKKEEKTRQTISVRSNFRDICVAIAYLLHNFELQILYKYIFYANVTQ